MIKKFDRLIEDKIPADLKWSRITSVRDYQLVTRPVILYCRSPLILQANNVITI